MARTRSGFARPCGAILFGRPVSIETLGHFIGSALEAGDAAIVVATEAHRQGLAEELKARGVDVSSAIEQGRYVPLDAVETMAEIMLDGWPDETRFAKHIGGVISRARAGGRKGERVE